MTITIYTPYSWHMSHVHYDITSGSSDVREAFHKQFGKHPVVDKPIDLLRQMSIISEWANDEMGQECLFDVE